MYFKRKIDQFLIDWKAKNRNMPLIVKGARQVGKTESVLNFARNSYNKYIYINFVDEPKYKGIISDGYKTNDIIKAISMLNADFDISRPATEKPLIIFDEIQAFPQIATALKFFALDGRYDVICSGSLLGIHYKEIESNSVGYKLDYEMSSMDFEEFLWVKGYSDTQINAILEHMVSFSLFSPYELTLFNSLFLDYCVLGGMPSIIKEYVQNGTFENVLYMQRQLVEDYKEDVRKYAIGLDQTKIINVFNQVPVQLAKENNKFQLSKISPHAKTRDYQGCIEWLCDSGIVKQCFCLNFPELPLKGNIDISKYKLYFADSGLLVSLLDDESQEDLRANKNLGTYKGALYENIVAEALYKSGLALYYYKKSDSTLEEDFFVRNKDNLIPVEVKATNGNSKSLKTLISSEKYPDISFGIKLCKGNIGNSNSIITLPYFCAFLLKRFLAEAKIEQTNNTIINTTPSNY